VGKLPPSSRIQINVSGALSPDKKIFRYNHPAEMNRSHYKVFNLVANLKHPAERLIVRPKRDPPPDATKIPICSLV
jgi:hypothetical protein